MRLIRALARPLLASSFIASGIDRVRHADETAQHLGVVVTPIANAVNGLDEKTLGKAIGGVQLGAGILLSLSKFPRLSGFVLALASTVNIAAEYANADTSTREGRTARRNTLLKNVSLLGATLLVSVDTSGRDRKVIKELKHKERTHKRDKKAIKHA